MHTYRKSSLLACFFDLLFDLFLCFFNHFLDTGRMDTTVVDQFFQSNAGNLTAYGVKTGNNYRLRRIVNDQVNTGQSFQCPDISALTANDTAFHFIIRQGYYRNSSFCYVVGRTTLNRQRNDLSGLLVCFLFRLLLQIFNEHCGFVFHFFFNRLKKFFFSIFGR